MNYDEFAFFNQQLAAMLRDGIPLEGALKQLCAGMKTGPLRNEMIELEKDLARGTPLPDAITRRALPEFYLRMVTVGVRSNDLPGMLTLLADYYQRTNSIWNRLKGLMVYPFLVLLVSLGLTVVISTLAKKFLETTTGDWSSTPPLIFQTLWIPPLIIGIFLAAGVAIVTIPSLRARARWWIPAFRETSLAQIASAMALMLKSGTPLPEALAFAEAIESGSPAAGALREWRTLLQEGQGKPAQWPQALSPFPPMFLWLVRKGGEDIAAGFQKAAEIYQSRASYKIELLLYGALPISVLLLGQMVIWQVTPVFRSLIWLMNSIGGDGGGL
ncbi:MAG TPA: type II secretion system F family protein [Verrucomicrobiae bacterium]|nr:type II secretion system F family protein [Verrucomicrobiae bacterium]